MHPSPRTIAIGATEGPYNRESIKLRIHTTENPCNIRSSNWAISSCAQCSWSLL